ncbi:MAG: DUF4040 domain-containing protein [Firmicutes bacterium]|nr:DUF4040 domain-containing protein [Bacillota bacterium]
MSFAGPDIINIILICFLITIAIAINFMKDLLYVVIVFGVYGLIMVLIWLRMNAPDLAITEAAAGVATTTLMIALIMRTTRKVK